MVSGMKPLRQVAIQINAESMVAYEVVHRAVSNAVYDAVNGAVSVAVNGAVFWAVDVAVYDAAVRWAVYEAVRERFTL